jgi:arginyl-tRNA synthetase
MQQSPNKIEKIRLFISEISLDIATPSQNIRYTLITVIKDILQLSGHYVTLDATQNEELLPKIVELFKSIQTSNQIYKASVSRQFSADLSPDVEETTFESTAKSWFIKTADFGDNYDQLLRHPDGRFTQLLDDITRYHQIFQQGYDKIILLRPPIYMGYDIQLTAAMQCLGYTKEQFQFIIVQPIKLYAFHKANQKIHPIPDLATEELISAIGMDALRWHSLRLPLNNIAPINISTAGQANDSLYRVQSAHYRCCTLLRQLNQETSAKVTPTLPIADKLNNLVKAVPQIIEQSADEIAPYLIVQHLEAISEICHQWLDSLSLTPPDYGLLSAVKQTIFDLLVNILNITAPEPGN